MLLRLSAEQVRFLRCELLTAREGLRADLAEFPEQFPDPARARREIAAYTRLIDGLARGRLASDRHARELVRTLCASIDASNEFHQALFQHRATYALLRCVVAGRGR